MPLPRDPDAIRRERALYYAVVTHMDEQIGRIFDVLHRRGLDRRTIVIFTSDNGLALGAHGLLGKQTLYDEGVRVPLIIRLPDGSCAGATRDALVYLHDLFPTVCAWTNTPVPAGVEGKNLADVFAGKSGGVRDAVFGQYDERGDPRFRMIRTQRYKLISHLKLGREELFDLDVDPYERNDLSAKPEMLPVRDALRDRLARWRAERNDFIGAATQPADAPRLVTVRKIWDRAPHNAFTDLIRFDGQWFCTFREAEAHVGGDGQLRVLTSDDGVEWSPAALLAESGIDLRDPKLSITPDGRLMIVAGGSVYRDRTRVAMQPRVAFSRDGRTWTPTQRVLREGDWLWRVTWHDGRAYGVGYHSDDPQRDVNWALTLWSSRDGVHYERVTDLDVSGRPNETTLRFLDDGTMIALVRREGGHRLGWIGTSRAPYTHWSWHETEHRLGGPDFVVLPDGAMWAASRAYGANATTVLARFGPTTYEPVLTLPSGGDCSYPGLVWNEGLLWISYYSSHEGKSSIYLATVKLPASPSPTTTRSADAAP